MLKHLVIAAVFVTGAGAVQADDVTSIWENRAALAPQTDPVYEAAQTRTRNWSPEVKWDAQALISSNVISRQELTWSGRI